MDMRFGRWNIKSLYRAGSLMTVSRELARYTGKLDLVGGRWHGICVRIHIFYGKGNENNELCTGFFVHKRLITSVKIVEFVSDRRSYIVLRSHWCHIIVLNVHNPTEDKTDDVKDSCEELERVFDKFPKYHMKILLGNCNAKVGRENRSFEMCHSSNI
jgi:hypothetical protein